MLYNWEMSVGARLGRGSCEYHFCLVLAEYFVDIRNLDVMRLAVENSQICGRETYEQRIW